MTRTPQPSTLRARWARRVAALMVGLLVTASSPLLSGCEGGRGCGAGFRILRRPQKEAESYDPSADRWRAVRSLPEATAGARAVTIGGMIYVVGGGETARWEFDPYPYLLRYDPARNRWVRLNDIPTARGGYGVAAVGAEIYVVGGVGGASFVEVFDTILENWRIEPDMPNDHLRFDTVSIGSTIYAPAGDTDLLDALDTTTGLWSPLTPLPVPLSDFAVVTDGARIFVMGGHDPADGPETPSRDLWIYDVAGDTWAVGAAMPDLGNYLSAAFDGTRIYLFGAFWPQGSNIWGAGDDRRKVLALDISTLSWATTKPKREYRYDVAAAVDGGIVYTFGGWGRQQKVGGCN